MNGAAFGTGLSVICLQFTMKMLLHKASTKSAFIFLRHKNYAKKNRNVSFLDVFLKQHIEVDNISKYLLCFSLEAIAFSSSGFSTAGKLGQVVTCKKFQNLAAFTPRRRSLKTQPSFYDSFHTNPSRNWSFRKRFSSPEGFENAGFVFKCGRKTY